MKNVKQQDQSKASVLDLAVAIPVKDERDAIAKTITDVWNNKPSSIIVCDNASSDGTGEAITALCDLYEDLVVVRNPYDLGALKNFELGLVLATTKYFAWIGAHDRVSADYYRTLTQILERDEEAVLAFADYCGESRYSAHYLRLLDNPEPCVRMKAFMEYTQSGSMFHGVYRTEIAKKAFVMIPSQLKTDAAILLQMLYFGKYRYCGQVCIENGKKRVETRDERDRRYQRTLFSGTHVSPWNPHWRKIYCVTQMTILRNAGCSLDRRLRIRYWPAMRFSAVRWCVGCLIRTRTLVLKLLGRSRPGEHGRSTCED
jgi:hypothetical protein